MKISEAKELICPINSNNCIVDKCPKWKFTKTRNIYEYKPEASCRCGNKTTEHEFCYNCGDCATKERAYIAYKTSDYGELEYGDKEGECTL